MVEPELGGRRSGFASGASQSRWQPASPSTSERARRRLGATGQNSRELQISASITGTSDQPDEFWPVALRRRKRQALIWRSAAFGTAVWSSQSTPPEHVAKRLQPTPADARPSGRIRA